ncbi:unannotated protein [freshwater metagenome]|uniref:Unannotated protein n=1 Tax=freshwater metagenome TaxID=449393 RepID=A0A6J6TIX8_9ZZZZ
MEIGLPILTALSVKTTGASAVIVVPAAPPKIILVGANVSPSELAPSTADWKPASFSKVKSAALAPWIWFKASMLPKKSALLRATLLFAME